MEIRNKINFTGYDAGAVIKELKSIKKGIKAAKSALSKATDAQTASKISLEIEGLNSKIKTITGDVKSYVKTPENQKESKIMNSLTHIMQKIAGSKGFEKKALESKGLAELLIWGNTAKELVGTGIYTVQALTNTDLPPDKRKFVGMYDLGVGVASTTLGAITGLVMLSCQDKFVDWIVGGKAARNLPGYARAFAGIAFFIPVVFQMILVKRIVAPMIATPVAGKLKAKLEAREAAKKGTPVKEIEIKPSDITIGMPKVDDKSQATLPQSTNLLQNARNLSIKA